MGFFSRNKSVQVQERNSDPTSVIDFVSSGDFGYEVVGESFHRDHLIAIIRSHKAFDAGELELDAYLVPEPTNEFDSNAVQVLIEEVSVGYIPKSDSRKVIGMLKAECMDSIKVKSLIGWNTENPNPLIGVRLDFTLDE